MAQIDFPPNPVVGQQFTAQNGIAYVCAGESPVIWQVVEAAAESGQRLWSRNTVDNYVFPVYAGDDVVIKDESGNNTTYIRAGGPGQVASLKTDNLLFAHMPPLPA
jgi:hypothetical protein